VRAGRLGASRGIRPIPLAEPWIVSQILNDVKLDYYLIDNATQTVKVQTKSAVKIAGHRHVSVGGARREVREIGA